MINNEIASYSWYFREEDDQIWTNIFSICLQYIDQWYGSQCILNSMTAQAEVALYHKNQTEIRKAASLSVDYRFFFIFLLNI